MLREGWECEGYDANAGRFEKFLAEGIQKGGGLD
jgi:hypothetical protein